MTAGWEGQASCRNLDQALFYPAKGDTEQADRARAVCARCPVREACLAATLADEKRLSPWDRDGIRAGLDGRERYVRQHGGPPRRSRRKKSTAVVKRRPPVRELAACGTLGAYDRHVRRGESIDAACREAKAVRYQTPRPPVPEERPECGSRSGYLWHVDRYEIPCEPCVAADAAVAWFVRECRSAVAS